MPPENIKQYISGMLTIELQSAQIAEFDDYFRSLKPSIEQRNPWISQYWEEAHLCDLPDLKSDQQRTNKVSSRPASKRKNANQRPKASCRSKTSRPSGNSSLADNTAGNSIRRKCTGREGLPSTYAPDTKVQFIYDAVLAFAYAVDRMQKDYCPNTTHVCPAMERVDGADFFRNYVLTVNVEGNSVFFPPHC